MCRLEQLIAGSEETRGRRNKGKENERRHRPSQAKAHVWSVSGWDGCENMQSQRSARQDMRNGDVKEESE